MKEGFFATIKKCVMKEQFKSDATVEWGLQRLYVL